MGVSANPDGAACYVASLRFHTSLALDPKTVHETGLREMARVEERWRKSRATSLKTGDVKGVLNRLRTDRQDTFKSEDDVLAYARAAVDRAESASATGSVLSRTPSWW